MIKNILEMIHVLYFFHITITSSGEINI